MAEVHKSQYTDCQSGLKNNNNNKTQLYVVFKKSTLNLKTQVKSKRQRKIYHANTHQKKVGVGLPWWSSGKESALQCTCRGAVKSLHHNYRAHIPWSLCATTREKPTHCNKRSRMPQRRSHVPQLRPDAAKSK